MRYDYLNPAKTITLDDLLTVAGMTYGDLRKVMYEKDMDIEDDEDLTEWTLPDEIHITTYEGVFQNGIDLDYKLEWVARKFPSVYVKREYMEMDTSKVYLEGTDTDIEWLAEQFIPMEI